MQFSSSYELFWALLVRYGAEYGSSGIKLTLRSAFEIILSTIEALLCRYGGIWTINVSSKYTKTSIQPRVVHGMLQ